MKEDQYLDEFKKRFIENPNGIIAEYENSKGELKHIMGIPAISEENFTKILRVITDDFKDVQAVEWVEPDFCGKSFEKWARNHAKTLLLIAWNMIGK